MILVPLVSGCAGMFVCVPRWVCVFRCLSSVVHTLSSFNLYEDAIQEAIEDFDELSDAISDPTTQ